MNHRRWTSGQVSDAAVRTACDELEVVLTAALTRMDELGERRPERPQPGAEETTCGTCWTGSA